MRSTAQFLGPAGIASSSRVSTLHQLMSYITDGNPLCAKKQKSKDFGKKAKHTKSAEAAVKITMFLV